MKVLFAKNNFKKFLTNEHFISLIAAFEEKIGFINLEQNAATVFVEGNTSGTIQDSCI